LVKRVAITQVLNWQATDERGDYVATVVCPVGVNNIAIQTGSLYRGENKISPRYMLVDNLANNANVGLVFGPFTYTVPRFTREVFRIPISTAMVEVTVSTGTVNVTVAENADGLVAGADQFAIQQAADQFVTYQWLTKTAGGSQLTTDQNFNLNLSAATAQNYNLLAIGGSTPNGWYNPRVKNSGVGRWSLVPNGANQINGIWTAANPLRLSQDDQIDFWCDGSQWRAHGTISYSNLAQSSALGATLTNAHGLNVVPDLVRAFLVCNAAEGGYAIGDRILLSSMAGYDSATQNNTTIQVDATNIIVIKPAAGSGYRFHNKTTRATFVATTANWDIDVEARAFI
jgi:hypothetical protein